MPRERRRGRARRRFVDAHGLTVRHGPFAGMRYVDRARKLPNIVSKLLGSFEWELHEAIEQIVAARPRALLNIGSAHGYYAIGLARRLPESRIYALELLARQRSLCLEIAEANGVADRIRVGGACDVAALRALPEDPTAVVCDCEGCEIDLLRPELVPFLRTAIVVVELHEAAGEAAVEELLSRFAGSHERRIREYGDSPAPSYPELMQLPEAERQLVARERRAEVTRWAVLTPTETP
jgi:hypothetical protein